jgi:hypothetical protein
MRVLMGVSKNEHGVYHARVTKASSLMTYTGRTRSPESA